MIKNSFIENSLLPFGDLLLQTSFIKNLKKCRKQDQLNADQLGILQKKRLSEILTFTTQNAEFYKKLEIEIDQANPISSLKKFPVISKREINEFKDEILTRPANSLNKISSSGSSGLQSTVYLSKNEISITRAQQTRWWEWAGYKLGDSILQTGISPDRSLVKKVKDYFLKTKYVHAFALLPEEIKLILKESKKKHVKNFFGYASSLYVFAEIAAEEGIDIKFESMLCWGDKMFESYRKKIKNVFACDVQETYGCTEGFMIASQHDLKYLYIMTPWVYLELLDENGQEVKDGEIGQVVVTSLFAKAFPLIRYKLGDLAIRLPKEKYPKNRKFAYPLLEKVIGRDTDIIKTSSNKSMIVHSFTGIFEYYPEIRQFQVTQNKLDEIQIKYISNQGKIDRQLNEIKNKIIQNLKEDITITFKEVSEIPNSPSGKPQIIKSSLKK